MVEDMIRLSIVVAAILFMPSLTSAALIPTLQKFITIEATPEYATPHSLVSLTVKSIGLGDIGAYRWMIDGKIVLEGVGQDRVSIKTGDIGTATRVEVTQLDSNGRGRSSATYILRPAEVDLLWEGDTSVPPFYAGRPLPNSESQVLLKAIPFFTSSESENEQANLVYQWSVDGKARADLSGYGKSSATARPPFFTRPFTVSVTVSTIDGSTAAHNEVVIQPVSAVALIYENNPLLNVLFNTALRGTMTLGESEATLYAFPLFVNDADNLSYTWTLNGKPAGTNADNPREATFRKTGSGGGTFPISVSFTSPFGSADSARTAFMLSL
jgi:hypothetical protein